MPFLLRYCKKRTHQFLNFQTTHEIFLPTGTLYSEAGGKISYKSKAFSNQKNKILMYCTFSTYYLAHLSSVFINNINNINNNNEMRQVKGNSENKMT